MINLSIIIPAYNEENSIIKILEKVADVEIEGIKREVIVIDDCSTDETLNLLVNRCSGDRGNLRNELEKVSNYLCDKKVLSMKEISTLTNLAENYSASELVDASLSKNLKKTQEILNENNYAPEDTFFILRVFLQKAKKILSLLEKIENKSDIEKVISEHRPPIFWKDKPVIKKQLELWSYKKMSNLIQKLNHIEITIKENNTLSIILMKNFIYEMLEQKISNSS